MYVCIISVDVHQLIIVEIVLHHIAEILLKLALDTNPSFAPKQFIACKLFLELSLLR